MNARDTSAEAVYIDFETLDHRIYLCGVRVGNGPFHSLWSEDVHDARSEKDLLLRIHDLLRTYSPSGIYYYAAERSMWKTACQRHGFTLDDPITRLLDHAVDLYHVLRTCGVLIRGSPNLKLKSVGKALYRHGMVNVEFPNAGIKDGSDSMTMAAELYITDCP